MSDSSSTSSSTKPFLECTVGTISDGESSGSSKYLHLFVLGCQPCAPYGPNLHTSRILLDTLKQAIEYNLQQEQEHDTPTSTTRNIACYHLRLTIYNVQQFEYPVSRQEWEQADGFLIPGSLNNAYANDEWILKLRQVIQTEIVAHHYKTLALCFGHQILAHSFTGGLATAVPTGPRMGLDTVHLTPTGLFLLLPNNTNKNSMLDLFVTHSNMVQQLPSCAVCLAGNDAVPVAAAAYFATEQQAQTVVAQAEAAASPESKTATTTTVHDNIRPFAISFQAHPEFSSSRELGYKATLKVCMEHIDEKKRRIAAETSSQPVEVLSEKLAEVEESFDTVQQNSIRVIAATGRLLGWF